MNDELLSKHRRGVLLGRSTQIDILQYLEKGKTYEEIDNILEVPRGSSEYTIKFVQKGF